MLGIRQRTVEDARPYEKQIDHSRGGHPDRPFLIAPSCRIKDFSKEF